MIPAAYDLLATLTARLLRGMADDDRHQTRRVIGKLAAHFYRFNSEQAKDRALIHITLALALSSDATLAGDCLAACTWANRDVEISAKLDVIPEIAEKLRKIERMLTGGDDAQ